MSLPICFLLMDFVGWLCFDYPLVYRRCIIWSLQIASYGDIISFLLVYNIFPLKCISKWQIWLRCHLVLSMCIILIPLHPRSSLCHKRLGAIPSYLGKGVGLDVNYVIKCSVVIRLDVIQCSDVIRFQLKTKSCFDRSSLAIVMFVMLKETSYLVWFMFLVKRDQGLNTIRRLGPWMLW